MPLQFMSPIEILFMWVTLSYVRTRTWQWAAKTNKLARAMRLARKIILPYGLRTNNLQWLRCLRPRPWFKDAVSWNSMVNEVRNSLDYLVRTSVHARECIHQVDNNEDIFMAYNLVTNNWFKGICSSRLRISVDSGVIAETQVMWINSLLLYTSSWMIRSSDLCSI